MTIEEKRRAIEEHCMSRQLCNGCPLAAFADGRNCYSPSDDPLKDADVERNYRIINEYMETADHPNCGLQPPIRLDTLLRGPARVVTKKEADKQGAGGIDITLNVDTSGLDAAIEKANRLVELLESASDLMDRIAQKA